MSQNKSIVAENQNFIPGSKGIAPDEVATKKQSMVSSTQDSRNAENGYKNNGNAGIQAANQQATRNKN
ncbi:hypothetical protein [Clostridium sp.]|uniref:hypothetical protein n=1 Tax=Clostridium sp. TaxID=1506 RepID=UPI003D6D9014